MRPFLTRTGTGLAVLLGVYLIGRAAVEPFVIDLSDPTTYAAAWGGPSAAGVLAVHMLPGAVSLVLLIFAIHRHRHKGPAPHD